MAQYGGGGPPRYGHSRPRFNAPHNRPMQRHNFNDMRPPLNRPTGPQSASTNSNAAKPNNEPANSTAVSTTDGSLDSSRSGSTDKRPTDIASYSSSHELNEAKSNDPSTQDSTGTSSAPKRSQSSTDMTLESSSNVGSQMAIHEKRTTQGGRCRLFIGNIPTDLTQDEFRLIFNRYGELVEYFANPSRGFGFVKLSSRQLAEQAKYDLDGYVLRGKPLRIRFASQGATIKVKNLSANVSNELLKEAFEQYFGPIERAVVIVDDRGKSTGEGIIEFEKKPSAQKCLNDCTERCFFITSELRPVIVEPWDTKDEEDGLPEKSLPRNVAYEKERQMRPRFAEVNSIEQTIGLKWKELELQEKQLLDEVKRRMQYATEQLQIEIDQMYLDHQSQIIRKELQLREEELRRIDELRSQEMDRRRQMMPMRVHDGYNEAFNMPPGSHNNLFHSNPMGQGNHSFNDYGGVPPFANAGPPGMDATYTTNQMARAGYGGGNSRSNSDEFHSQPTGFDRKRPRY